MHKRLPMLVAKILATKFGFVPDWLLGQLNFYVINLLYECNSSEDHVPVCEI